MSTNTFHCKIYTHIAFHLINQRLAFCSLLLLYFVLFSFGFYLLLRLLGISSSICALCAQRMNQMCKRKQNIFFIRLVFIVGIAIFRCAHEQPKNDRQLYILRHPRSTIKRIQQIQNELRVYMISKVFGRSPIRRKFFSINYEFYWTQFICSHWDFLPSLFVVRIKQRNTFTLERLTWMEKQNYKKKIKWKWLRQRAPIPNANHQSTCIEYNSVVVVRVVVHFYMR